MRPTCTRTDALKALGLTHGGWRTGGDFTVTTDRKHKRDRSTGLRYVEFGDASARIEGKALATVEANADALARQELQVMLIYGSDGRLVTTIVSSKHNQNCIVTILRGGVWSYRRACEPSVEGSTN